MSKYKKSIFLFIYNILYIRIGILQNYNQSNEIEKLDGNLKVSKVMLTLTYV